MTAAARLLDLVEREGLAEPDQLLFEDDVVLFYWHEQKLCIEVAPDREDVGLADYQEATKRNPLTDAAAARSGAA